VGGLSLLNAVIDSGAETDFPLHLHHLWSAKDCAHTEKAARWPGIQYGATTLTSEHALELYDRAYGLRFVSFATSTQPEPMKAERSEKFTCRNRI